MASIAPVSEVQTNEFKLDGHYGVVIPLFLAHFDRAPEHEAFTYYTERYDALLQSEPSTDAAGRALAREIYLAGQGAGELPADGDSSNADYVNTLYANVLGRDGGADPEGLNYWTQALEDGTPREDVALAFITAAAGSERDGAFLENRAEVAAQFALIENSGPDVLDGLAFNAAEILEGVTEDPATVAAALERLETAQGEQPGDGLTLTPEADALTGGEGDDVFSAPLVDGQQTLGSDDSIDGGGGNNTLRADVVAAAGAELAAPTLNGVQQIEPKAIGSGDTGLDLANVVDTESIRIAADEQVDVRFANASAVDAYTLVGAGRDSGAANSLTLDNLTGENNDVRLENTEAALTATLANDVEALNLFLQDSAVSLDLRATDLPLDDLKVAVHHGGENTTFAPSEITVANIGELTLETHAPEGTEEHVLSLNDASGAGLGLQSLKLTGEGATSFTWSEDTSNLRSIDAQELGGGVTIDASAFVETETGPLVIDGSEGADRIILSEQTTVAGQGGDDTFVLVGDSVSLLGIEDFDTGDRLEFAIPEGESLTWNGDMGDLGVNLDFEGRGLDAVRDDLTEAVGESGVGYFEYEGEVYVVGTGDVNGFIHMGNDIELTGAVVEDNALMLA